MRPWQTFIAAIAAIAAASGILWLSFSYFQFEELTKARGRLSLYRSTVTAELERFSHLSYVLARDPFVISTTLGADPDRLNPRLRDFAERAGLDAIYLMQPDGLTISASNADGPASFVGQSYSFRPYFKDALAGTQGRFYGIGATTGLPGYFIADAVRDGTGQTTGVIAIKIDLSKLEESWRQAGEQVFLANADGVVLLASDPSWRYRAIRPLSPAELARINATRQFPGQPIEALDWHAQSDQRAEVAGADWLHLTAADLPHDWTLHYFASDATAVARSWLVTGAAVILAGVALILLQVQRARRMGAALRRSEEEEAQLRQANERLAIEIDERRAAERRLKRTQGELERASRLAALGQLAASVTHELGQPIAAMRNHLAAAELSRPDTTGFNAKISGLVDRMQDITRQLKFFARTEVEDFGNVDLRDAMNASLSLVEPNIDATGTRVDLNFPDGPVMIRASRLRLEQVFTNLLRNAIDSVEDVEDPKVIITLGTAADGAAWVEIADNGHGLGDATLADLQEPFVTTRESGRGMGLGLAISAGIVNDHGGEMSAWNGEGGGAVFRVAFPPPNPQEGPGE